MEMSKLKKTLSFVALIISILGLITFSLFIFEESLQVTMFGTWPAQDAGDWDMVLEGLDLMESLNLGMKVVNYSVGWLQPLAFFSYRSYSKSTDYYIKAVKAKAFARAPEVFEGREIEFHFKPTRIVEDKDGMKLINRNIIIILPELKIRPSGSRFKVRGTVKVLGSKIIISKPVLFSSVSLQDQS